MIAHLIEGPAPVASASFGTDITELTRYDALWPAPCSTTVSPALTFSSRDEEPDALFGRVDVSGDHHRAERITRLGTAVPPADLLDVVPARQLARRPSSPAGRRPWRRRAARPRSGRTGSAGWRPAYRPLPGRHGRRRLRLSRPPEYRRRPCQDSGLLRPLARHTPPGPRTEQEQSEQEPPQRRTTFRTVSASARRPAAPARPAAAGDGRLLHQTRRLTAGAGVRPHRACDSGTRQLERRDRDIHRLRGRLPDRENPGQIAGLDRQDAVAREQPVWSLRSARSRPCRYRPERPRRVIHRSPRWRTAPFRSPGCRPVRPPPCARPGRRPCPAVRRSACSA